ncbi:hypothetical protein [Sphingopyxis sp. H050]|jgi:hypothetical protein|uniref:hypothetical protein n=1 Tax=Sphingopyxis sp. H050 TaxID=1759072 RepID=UPI000AD34797|nr:hypothetical protein [Sphingopyxis sp. H050]
MRYSPLLPTRRPIFGRRIASADQVAPVAPTREERRLLDRIISHMGQRTPR